MLKFFREHARGGFMIVVIGIIIIVFVLYFGSSRGGRTANAIAIVDKKIISEAEFHDEYGKLLDMARLRLGAQLTPETLKKMDLKRKAYNDLLNRYVIAAKAADLNIQVSDEELRNLIMSMPVLQTNGVFDERKYQQILRYNKLTAEDFENLQRFDLIANKIESIVREGIKISEQEVYDLYALQNQKVNVNFIQISAKDIKKKISPNEAELENYLKHNSNLFRIPEQIKIKYLFFAAGSKGKQTAQLEAKKARNAIYQENNMEEYAKENNLTVHYTDFFPINKMPPELSSIKNITEELVAMREKDVSRVLTNENGYFLLQLIDKKASYVPKLNTIQNEVRNRFIESEMQILAEKEAQSILEKLKSGESLDKIAKENGLKVNETGFFQPGNAIPKLGFNENATEILFQLSANKPLAEKPLFINNSYVILKLKDVSKLDEKDFEAKKSMYQKMMISIKRDEAMRTWLEGNKEIMIKEKRIKIKKQLEDL